jgi:hypothetical protein
MVDAKRALSDVPRRFVLWADVHENVRALRVAAGSVVSELSAARLAALIAEKHSDRRISASLVQRWETSVEPDYESTGIMAELAGVTFEEFAMGDPAKRKRAPLMKGFARTDAAKPAKKAKGA